MYYANVSVHCHPVQHLSRFLYPSAGWRFWWITPSLVCTYLVDSLKNRHQLKSLSSSQGNDFLIFVLCWWNEKTNFRSGLNVIDEPDMIRDSREAQWILCINHPSRKEEECVLYLALRRCPWLNEDKEVEWRPNDKHGSEKQEQWHYAKVVTITPWTHNVKDHLVFGPPLWLLFVRDGRPFDWRTERRHFNLCHCLWLRPGWTLYCRPGPRNLTR